MQASRMRTSRTLCSSLETTQWSPICTSTTKERLHTWLTVSSKTVAKQRFLSARCMWCLRAWEWRLVLGRKSIVLLGYLTVFWTCDLAQYSKRYDLFKLGLSLQWFWSCWNIHIFEVYLKFISTSMAFVCLKHGLNPFRHAFNQFLICCH